MTTSRRSCFRSFRSMLPIWPLSVLLLLAAAGTTPAAALQTPTHRILAGESVALTLDLDRLAVRFRADADAERRINVIRVAGLAVTAIAPTGARGWHLLSLESPLRGATDAASRMSDLVSAADVEFVSPVFAGEHGGWMVVTPDILVRFREDSHADTVAILASLMPELQVVEPAFGAMDGAYKLRSNSRSGFDVLRAANALAADDRIAWAEPDWQFSVLLDLIPDDPDFSLLWGILNTGQFGGVPGMDMGVTEAWDITTGDPGIIILIFDTGVEQSHPDINQIFGNNFASDNFIESSGDPVNECDNHGTAVAGCVTAKINNSRGVVGVAPDCRVASARMFITDVPCANTGTAQASWIVTGLAWGESRGARVSNHSYSGLSSEAMDDKFAETYANGMVHFSSAGNGARRGVGSPARLPSVNAISAITPSGTLASFSNYGPLVAFTAPGTSVYTTDRTGADGYSSGDNTWFGGTSAASPYAAAVAALVLSANPSLTAPEVEEIMRCSARDLGDPGFDTLYGYGFPNAHDAVVAALNPDSDSDGVFMFCDNCPDLPNTDQADADADGIGDLCDNCPAVFNPGQEDENGDDLGDACSCVCDCHGNPQCDADVDVLDVVQTVAVAFRNDPALDDPNPLCPKVTTDADCNGQTDVLDVVKFVNVGFRNEDPATQFCDPCAP